MNRHANDGLNNDAHDAYWEQVLEDYCTGLGGLDEDELDTAIHNLVSDISCECDETDEYAI